MRAIKTIEKQLKEYEELLDAAVEQDEKDFMKGLISETKKELKEAEDAKNNKVDKKPAAKKAPAKKKEKAYIEVDGKKIFQNDPLFCAKLTEQWEKRRKAQKKADGKHKTRSVMQIMAHNAASTVIKGIKSIETDDLEKNPEKEIKKIKRLESASIELIAAYKDVVGEKLTQKEIKEEFEGVNDVISKITNKYTKKSK